MLKKNWFKKVSHNNFYKETLPKTSTALAIIRTQEWTISIETMTGFIIISLPHLFSKIGFSYTGDKHH